MLVHSILIATALAAGMSSQRVRPARVFVYDPAAMAAIKQAEDAKLAAAAAAEEEAAKAEKAVVVKTMVKPPSYVNISGNFGGVFYVTGVGSSTSQSQTNLVNITTNRSLTFSANSFKPLQLGNSSEGSMGSVVYSMALYQGTSSHVGSLVAGPVTGTDASFNGQTLAVNVAQIPAAGNLVLVISRTLTLTGQAMGATTLVGTGYIGVAIN